VQVVYELLLVYFRYFGLCFGWIAVASVERRGRVKQERAGSQEVEMEVRRPHSLSEA
jgi:hypothetical protein